MNLFLLTLALTGCKKVEPAPADLDGLVHFFWQEWETGDDAQLREGLANLHDAVDGDTLDDAIDGFLTGIDQEHLDVVGLSGPDPSAARGWFMARSFTCDVEQLERILTHDDQMALYPDIYESYERRFDAEPQGFLDRNDEVLTWNIDLEGDYFPLGFYSEKLSGGIRRVQPVEDDAHGDLLVTRTFMTEPAVFEKKNDWPQDYQIEMFWPRGDQILHVYGMWREMDLGGSLSTDSDGFVRITLNNMADWDDQTETLCAEGTP